MVCKAPNVLLLINEIHFSTSTTLLYIMCSLEPDLFNTFLAIFFQTKTGTKRQCIKKMIVYVDGSHAIQTWEEVKTWMEHGQRAALFNSSSSILLLC